MGKEGDELNLHFAGCAFYVYFFFFFSSFLTMGLLLFLLGNGWALFFDCLVLLCAFQILTFLTPFESCRHNFLAIVKEAKE